jgi:hypothetical protein
MQGGKGVRVGAPLTRFRGVLSGIPIYNGNDPSISRARNDAAGE